MRDVCPKCLQRVKPEVIPDTGRGNGFVQLWRCPECGGKEKMCRWKYKLPEELVENSRTPEQKERRREQIRERKRIYAKSNRAKINRRNRNRYASDPKYREMMRANSHRYYWRNRDEILAKEAEYRNNNADYLYARKKQYDLKRYREQKAKEQKGQECMS